LANFYNHLLEIASKSKLTIYWGRVGFSVRIYLPEIEDLASIIYAYQPNDLNIYFGCLPWPDEKATAIRKELLINGFFGETPKSLTVKLENKDLSKAKKACELALEKIEAIARERGGKSHA
jgi:hypothetical protein